MVAVLKFQIGGSRMSSRTFNADKLDISGLACVTDLAIHNIRKADWKKLIGLDELPLRSLELRGLSSPDLTVVPFPNTLLSLRVWHSSKLKSLAGLETATGIKELYLRDNGRTLDISAITALTQLEHLIIDGGYGDAQTLESLAAIEEMPIQELTLINVSVDDLDLGPIARLPSLRRLRLSERMLASEQVARIAAAKPWYYDQLKTLPQANGTYADQCKKCGQFPHELFLKGKKFLWCLECQKTKVAEHLADFDALVSAHINTSYDEYRHNPRRGFGKTLLAWSRFFRQCHNSAGSRQAHLLALWAQTGHSNSPQRALGQQRQRFAQINGTVIERPPGNRACDHAGIAQSRQIGQ